MQTMHPQIPHVEPFDSYREMHGHSWGPWKKFAVGSAVVLLVAALGYGMWWADHHKTVKTPDAYHSETYNPK